MNICNGKPAIWLGTKLESCHMPFRGVYNFCQANNRTASYAFQFYNAAHADSCQLGWKLGDVDDEKRFSIYRSAKESVHRF